MCALSAIDWCIIGNIGWLMDARRLEVDADFPGYFWCQISQDPQNVWSLLAYVETRLGLARFFGRKNAEELRK
jgi:hypothetical protein